MRRRRRRRSPELPHPGRRPTATWQRRVSIGLPEGSRPAEPYPPQDHGPDIAVLEPVALDRGSARIDELLLGVRRLHPVDPTRVDEPQDVCVQPEDAGPLGRVIAPNALEHGGPELDRRAQEMDRWRPSQRMNSPSRHMNSDCNSFADMLISSCLFRSCRAPYRLRPSAPLIPLPTSRCAIGPATEGSGWRLRRREWRLP